MKNLYIDFDGVIMDTINVTYKMLEDKNIDKKDSEKVIEFYKNLDWKKVLENTPQINESIKCIHKIMRSNKFNL